MNVRSAGSRRPSRWRAGALAAIVLLLGRPIGAAADDTSGFVPPDGPVKLTRTVERALGDGGRVFVSRSWRIRFTRIASGFRIDGETIAVEIEAPAKVAAIAKVERERPDHTFPMLLDEAGMIVPSEPVDPGPVPGLTEAAAKMLAKESPEKRAQGTRLVAMLQANGAKFMNHWPEDLFYPAAGDHRQHQAIPLPDGTIGESATLFSGTRDSSGHRLSSAERRVTTIVSGDRRTMIETWTLASLE